MMIVVIVFSGNIGEIFHHSYCERFVLENKRKLLLSKDGDGGEVIVLW